MKNKLKSCSAPLVAALFCAVAAAQPGPDAADQLTLDGDLAAPLTLTLAALAKMPRETVELAEPNGAKISYEGVPLSEILKKAGVALGKELRGKALSTYVLAEARDGYQVVFSIGELDPELSGSHVIVADRLDGKPLSAQQGPLRIVVGGDKRPARSVRMLEKLHVVQLRK